MAPLNLDGVFAVPPLSRHAGGGIDFDAAEQIARHIEQGGISRFLYGGNAFLYHASLGEFEALAEWLSGFPPGRWPIPRPRLVPAPLQDSKRPRRHPKRPLTAVEEESISQCLPASLTQDIHHHRK